jgi:hypothetical protein
MARRGIMLIRVRLDTVNFNGFQNFIENEYFRLSGGKNVPNRRSLDLKSAIRLVESNFLPLYLFKKP